MEKVLEKLKTEDKSTQRVVDYLVSHCEKVPSFKDKILNDKKSLSECWEYIKSKARKEAKNGCAMIKDDVVFGWAIHYFDEEELEDWKEKPKNTPKSKRKKTTKPKPKKEEDKPTQISFEF